MDSDPVSPSLGALLAELGDAVVSTDETVLGRLLGPAFVWSGSDPLPSDGSLLIIGPRVSGPSKIKDLIEDVPSSPSRVFVFPVDGKMDLEDFQKVGGTHVVVGVEASVNPAQVAVILSRLMQTPDESVSRRLTSLQRTLSQSLTEQEPVSSLCNRLKRMCNATAALIDRHGQTVHSTGPVPLALLFGELSRTAADSQRVDSDGWSGIAARIADPGQEGEHYGWLVLTARRHDFPDAYAISAVHVAATLIEASQRMAVAAREQERAIRSAVLEEALALRREPNDPELAGRISALGLSFTDEMRAIALRPVRPGASHRGAPGLEVLSNGLRRLLRSAPIPNLMTSRDDTLVVVAQCSPQTLKRLIVAEGKGIPAAHVGVGRRIHGIGDIVDSYQDAQLAIRSLDRTARGARVMAYEEFDYATRLFADVGLDKMTVWANQFLEPLREKGALVEGLQTYFEHSQNINAAADSLNIHHNSLRYRLGRVEDLLNVSLRDPATVSSLFLALTALELSGVYELRPQLPGRATADSGRPSDVEAPGTATAYRPATQTNTGIVRGPDR